MVRFNSAGRIQPTEYRNLLQPGQCALCNRIGRTPDEIFANFSVELEYYGMLYLCQDCCNEVVSFMEGATVGQVADLRAAIREWQKGYDDLFNENQYLKELLNVRIKSAGRGEFSSNGIVSLPIFETEQPTAELDRESKSDEPESAESGAR